MAEWTDSPSPLTALLGPTNTGKTHRAVEQMLLHASGMLGLPLRLLAREVYDRVTVRVGEQAVALVTGEEKRIPPRPRYWVCTVEAMPVGREVDFLAVDEIQLACHVERGHVFTDRLLHARGRRETWFMGAATVRALVERLLPTAHIQSHPRLSHLSYAGKSSLGRLPPRSAVVAFSAQEVYELAERLRHKKGGAAVVLGALSPRTRNAQVALYQSGEVDYLVATDAIGMGLNMNVDHVALASLRKFDGKEHRPLETAELAQIAGRAGRYLSDGTFGTLEPLGGLPAAVVSQIEQHQFLPDRQLVWRNSDLDTSSLDNLLLSLQKRPFRPELRLIERAVDAEALIHLGRQPRIRCRAGHPEAVALLWEVCQIPDFGHFLVEHHSELLAEVFLQLSGPEARLDPDWMARRIARLDRTEGDLDSLIQRLESIRTWNYVSHHSRWVPSAREWQARTEQVEERLSDALHLRLVERFVQKGRPGATRTRVVTPPSETKARRRGLEALKAWFGETQDSPQDPAAFATEALIEAPHQAFVLSEAGAVTWQDREVARLVRGRDLLHPGIRVLEDGTLDLAKGTRLMVERRLLAWTRDLVDELLGPLRSPETAALSGAAKGLLYQLEQGLGTVDRQAASAQVSASTEEDRSRLGRLGVCLGQSVVYLSRSLRPRSIAIREALITSFLGRKTPLPHPAPPSFEADPAASATTYLALGYPVVGRRAIRADLLDRAERRLVELAENGSLSLPRELGRWLGCRTREVREIVQALGYRIEEEGGTGRARPRRRKPRRRRSEAGQT